MCLPNRSLTTIMISQKRFTVRSFFSKIRSNRFYTDLTIKILCSFWIIASLEAWKSNGIRGVWICVPIERSSFISIAAEVCHDLLPTFIHYRHECLTKLIPFFYHESTGWLHIPSCKGHPGRRQHLASHCRAQQDATVSIPHNRSRRYGC
jgi:hypothetical protein